MPGKGSNDVSRRRGFEPSSPLDFIVTPRLWRSEAGGGEPDAQEAGEVRRVASGLRYLERTAFSAGDVIFEQGEPGHCAYVVQKGRVRIDLRREGKWRVLGHVGGLFGEMALVDRAPRMARATAVAPTACLVIPEAFFVRKFAEADPFVLAMMRIFVNNIRSLEAGDPPPGTELGDQGSKT